MRSRPVSRQSARQAGRDIRILARHSQDYFLFIGNDNDFITQDDFQVGAPYKAPGGADVDTMLLVYRVTLPGFAGH